MQQSIAGKKKKSAEIPTEEWISKVNRMSEVKCGDWFGTAIVKTRLADYDASNTTVNRILRKMTLDGVLEQKLVPMGTKMKCLYRRRRSDVDWLAVPWRKRSNEGLGIRPDRLGVMGR